MAKSGLTLDGIKAWGGDELFMQGLEIVNKGDVFSISYNAGTRTVSGEFRRPDGWDMPVSFVLKENGGIEPHCPCYQNQVQGRVCPHVVALGIAAAIANACTVCATASARNTTSTDATTRVLPNARR